MPLPANECASERTFPPRDTKGMRGSFRRAILLTLISAALFVFCAPGKPWPWLAWVLMAPMLYQLQKVNAPGGFFLAGLFGWLMWFVSVWWLHAPLHDMLGMPVGGAIVFVMGGCVLMALPYAIAGTIVC